MAKSDHPGWQKSETAGAVILTLIVAAVWLGMLLGVSFLATPVKFMAPSLIAAAVVVMLVAGRPPVASSLHILYIVLDIVKLLGLLLIVVDTARRAVGGTTHTLRLAGNAPCD